MRRELLWAIALKLIVLFTIKWLFFPHRLDAHSAERGVIERVATSTPAAGKATPGVLR